MKSGRLRHQITIQQVTETKNATTGAVTSAWSTYKTRWASIDPVTGKEGESSDARFAEVTHKMRLRWVSGVTPKMRVSYDSRTFDIKAALNVGERDRELLLLTTERV